MCLRAPRACSSAGRRLARRWTSSANPGDHELGRHGLCSKSICALCASRVWSGLTQLFLGLFSGLAELDDVALREEDFLKGGAPLWSATQQELQVHAEVLELLLLRVLHDRFGL